MTDDLQRGNEPVQAEDIDNTQANLDSAANSGNEAGLIEASLVGEAGGEAIGQAGAVTTLSRPAPGQTVVVTPSGDDTYLLDFDPNAAQVQIEGANLVLGFDDDGDGEVDSRIVFENLAAEGAEPTTLQIGGVEVPSDVLVGQALALAGEADAPLDEVAAGPGGGAGGGGSSYDDFLGTLYDLLVAQGVIPGTELQFGLIETEGEIFFEEDDEPLIISTENSLLDEDDLVPFGSDQTDGLVDAGQIVVNYFDDQPADLMAAFAFTGGSPATGPNGQAITYTPSGQSMIVSIGGVDVFEVEITGVTDNGGGNITYEYTVTLLSNMDHLFGDNGQNSFVFTPEFNVTDVDGDTASASFDVTVVDDVPTANIVGGEGSVLIDETAGLQNNDTTDAGVIAFFTGVSNPGSDGADFPQYAVSFFPLVSASGATGADDDGATTVLSLAIVGGNGTPSGLSTTDGDPISLFLEDGLIVGRYDSDGDADIDGDDDAAFAITLQPDGTVAVAQYVSLTHPDNPNNFDEEVDLAGLVNAVVTVTDGDGDVATDEVAIGDQIRFDDDGPAIDVDGGEGSVRELFLNLDETIDPDLNNTPDEGQDYYNGLETESNGGDPNGDTDDIVGQLAVDGTNPIGSLTTANSAVATLFSVSGDAGTDGEKSLTHSFALVLSEEGLESTLSVTPAADGGNPEALLDGITDLKIYFFTAPDGTIEGRVGGEDGPVALRITLYDPDDTILGDETITVEQILAIDHGEDGNLYDTELPLHLVEGSLSVELTSTLTDGDDDEDSDSHSVTLVDGNTTFVSFDDDGPKVEISANTVVTVAHDETAGVDPDADDTDDAAVATLFDTVADKGDDMEGYAQSDAALVTIDVADFGTDGATESAATEYSLMLGEEVEGIVDSGLQTTDGHAIHLFLEGGIIVGRVSGGEDDGDAAFAVAIDSEDGTISIAQWMSLKHPDNPDEFDEPVSLLNEAVKVVVTLTDGDGDTTSDSAFVGSQISFEDDGPTAAIDGGEGSVTIDESAGQQDDDTTDGGMIALFAGVSDPGTDAGFPQYAVSLAALVDTSGSSTGADDEGATVALSLKINGVDGADSGLTTTDGDQIFLFEEGDLIVGRVGGSDGDAAFAIAIQPDGTVAVAQYLSLTHPTNPTEFDEAVDLTGLVNAVVTVTDGDGDVDTATFEIGDKINFEDDGPIPPTGFGIPLVAIDETAGLQKFDTIDQDVIDLFTGVSNPGSDGADLPQYAVSPGTFSAFGGSPGADDEGATTVLSLAIVGGDGTPSGLSTTGGDPISLFLEDGLIVGRYDSNGDASIDDADDAAFAISLQPDGTVAVAQYVSLFHNNPNNHDDSLTLAGKVNAVVTITDGDGDVVAQEVGIGELILFYDDGPTANDDDDTAAVGGPAVSGNVIDGTEVNPGDDVADPDPSEVDSAGTDGLGVIRSITHGGVTYELNETGDGIVDGLGTFVGGVLTITTAEGGEFSIAMTGANIGDYTYTPPATGPLSSSSEAFDYVIEDGDGDQAEATLTINLDDIPTAEAPAQKTHDESAGLQGDDSDGDDASPTEDDNDDDITAPAGLVTAAGAAAGGLALTAIGAIEQTLAFDVGLDDGVGSGVSYDSAVDATTTGLVMTETGKDVYFYVDPSSNGDLVLGVTLTDGADPSDGIDTGEIEDVVFSLHLTGESIGAGDDSATSTFIQYEAVVHPTPGTGLDHDEPLTNPLTIDYVVEDDDGQTASATISIQIEDDGPSISVTQTSVVHDESPGLQDGTDGATATEDDDDDDVVAGDLPIELTARLAALTLSGQIGQAISGSAVVAADGGQDGLDSLTLEIGAGGVSGLTAVDGGAITLAVDSELPNLVLGTDMDGDVVLAIYLGGDGKVSVVQYEAIEHDTDGTGLDHDDSVQLDDGVLFAVATDGDGDTASVDIGEWVKIEDDGPSTSENDQVVADEDDIAGANGNPGGPGDDAEANLTGTLSHDFGTDGPGTIDFASMDGETDTIGNTSVTYDWNAGTKTLTAYVTGGILGVDDVFKVELSGTNNQNYTFTLLAAISHHASGDDVETDAFASLTYTVIDGDGDTTTGTLSIKIDDDTPENIAPEAAVIGSGAGSTFSGDLDFFDNVGADRPGDVVFDPSLNNSLLAGVTSDGDAIYLQITNDGHTLIGWADVDGSGTINEGDTQVFTVVLNPDAVNEGDDEYLITLLDNIDTGAEFTFDDFSSAPAGQNLWIGLDFDGGDINADNNDSMDLLITPTDDGTINTDADDMGNANQWIDTGEGLRIDFVIDVERHAGLDEKDANGWTHEGHYSVDRFSFKIHEVQGSGNTVAVLVSAFLDPDGDLTVGDGAPVTLSPDEVIVRDENGVDVTASVTIWQFGDSLIVQGLEEGWQVQVISDTSFNSIETENANGIDGASGDSFSLSEYTLGTEAAGDPIDLSFGLDVVDEDGDTAEGTLEVTVLPQVDGTSGDDTLTAGTNGGDLQGGAGDDVLIGSDADDKLQGGLGNDEISDGAGNDVIIGGDGADVINLAGDGFTDILEYNDTSEGGDTVTGFNAGDPAAGGDVVDLVDLLDGGDFTGTTLAEAVADGFVTLNDNGGNAEISVDLDGSVGGGAAELVATLNGVNIADLSDNIVVD